MIEFTAIKIFGLQRSCTNLIAHLIGKNFFATTDDLTGDWKHGYCSRFPPPCDYGFYRTVVCHKDPYAWLASFYKWCQGSLDDDPGLAISRFSRAYSFEQFLHSPCYDCETPMDRWNRLNGHWISLCEDRELLQTVAVEDLYDPQGQRSAMDRLSQAFHLVKRRGTGWQFTQNHRVAVDEEVLASEIDYDYYRNQCYLDEYSAGALEFASSRLDQHLLARLGYRVLGSRSGASPTGRRPEAPFQPRRNSSLPVDKPTEAASSAGTDGIIIFASSVHALTSAWVAVELLRFHGCTAPIEIRHRNRWDCDCSVSALFESHGVRCAPLSISTELAHLPDSALKTASIRESAFDRILLLDPQTVPLANPSPLFGRLADEPSGILGWPGLGMLGHPWPAGPCSGAELHVEPDFDGSQILIDRSRATAILNLAWRMASRRQSEQDSIAGLDEIQLASLQLEIKPGVVSWRPRWTDGALIQYDLDGTPLFQQRRSPPWNLFQTWQRVAGFRHEAECLQAIRCLGKNWMGVLHPCDPPPTSETQLAQKIQTRQHYLFTKRAWFSPNVRQSCRISFHVGSGVRSEGNCGPDIWFTESHPLQHPILVLIRKGNVLARLSEGDDGSFWGTTADDYHEEIHLQPIETTKGPLADVAESIIRQRLYRYIRYGHDERNIELLAGGVVGRGAAGCEQSWALEMLGDNCPALTFSGNGGITCRLRLDRNGIWKGNWLVHERMLVVLYPRAIPRLYYLLPEFTNRISPDEIKNVFEIGCGTGAQTIALRDYYNCPVYVFEPNPATVEACRSAFSSERDIEFVEKGAWRETGTADFHAVVNGNPFASSFLLAHEDYPYERYVQERMRRNTIRLDDWCRERRINEIGLLCIDAQGACLPVLQGLGTMITCVKYIFAEIGMRPVYQGEPLLDEIVPFLAQHGFKWVTWLSQWGVLPDGQWVPEWGAPAETSGLDTWWGNYLFVRATQDELEAAEAVALQRHYMYQRVGYDSREMELSPGGIIGKGSGGCERFWHVEKSSSSAPELVISDGVRITCRLAWKSEVWTGNWLVHEKMPVKLTPLPDLAK